MLSREVETAEIEFDDLSWRTLNEDAPFEAVVVASSLGGFEALRSLLGSLPADFPAAILIAQHRAPESANVFAGLLSYATALRVKQAEERDRITPATVFVAPSGCHLEVTEDGGLSIARSGRVRFVCPSADLLFESASRRFQERAIGVVLTGMGKDGAEGAKAIRSRGGFVIAQDAATSLSFDMPYSAIETRKVDIVLPLEQIGFALETLLRTKSLLVSAN